MDSNCQTRRFGFPFRLAAEKIIGAEKQGEKITVEIKSFVSPSELEDLKNTLEQYILYEKILNRAYFIKK